MTLIVGTDHRPVIMLRMIRLHLTVLLLLTGCASKEDPRLLELRTPGKSRSEIHALLGPPRQELTRPATGWNFVSASEFRAERIAADFEKEKATTVQTAEAYWVPRGFMGLGVYFDYYLYDANERLLHYWRRFVD